MESLEKTEFIIHVDIYSVQAREYCREHHFLQRHVIQRKDYSMRNQKLTTLFDHLILIFS